MWDQADSLVNDAAELLAAGANLAGAGARFRVGGSRREGAVFVANAVFTAGPVGFGG
jgi:hypothetical protein